MMKQKSIKKNGKIKRMLFLCIGIMVFATVSGTASNPKDNVRKFRKKFTEAFEDVFENETVAVSKYETEITNQLNAYTACKENLLYQFEKHQAFYSEKKTRSAEIDEKVKAEVDKFLKQTPVLPKEVLKLLPDIDADIGKGAFGTILGTMRDDIVVKKLDKTKTKLTDLQREVAFATMFYLQYPELAPIMYGYTEDTEDKGSYYIYMEKFDTDSFEYFQKVIRENNAYSKSQLVMKKGVPSPSKVEQPSMTVMEVLIIATEFAENLGNALQKAGITHNDIRNENILIKVNGDGSLKFAMGDFGLATFSGLYYRTHQQILLYEDGNNPYAEDYEHRIIINPFQKLAYVFGVKMDNEFGIAVYDTIINEINRNDKYSLGISLYEVYLQNEIYNRLGTLFKNKKDQEAMNDLVTYVKQHLNTLKSPDDFKKYLLNNAKYFGEEARDRYFNFIGTGISAFEAFDDIDLESIIDDKKVKQYIEAGKEVKQYFEAHKKVKQYIQTYVVVVWQNFEKTYEKKKLTFEDD